MASRSSALLVVVAVVSALVAVAVASSYSQLNLWTSSESCAGNPQYILIGPGTVDCAPSSCSGSAGSSTNSTCPNTATVPVGTDYVVLGTYVGGVCSGSPAIDTLTAFAADICIPSEGLYYIYSCAGSTINVKTYTAAGCTGSPSSSSLSAGCTDGLFYLCSGASALAPMAVLVVAVIATLFASVV